MKDKIIELLKENLTDRGFKLWQAIDKRLPDIWDKLSSSTKKYHKKADGSVPSIAEHTYEMLYAGAKIMRMFGAFPKTSQADSLLLSVVLHDALKYGRNGKGNRGHTVRDHDKIAADMISANRETFRKILNKFEFTALEESVRFHAGRWSTDVANEKKFDFYDMKPEVLFLHMLDMLSTGDLIKLPEG